VPRLAHMLADGFGADQNEYTQAVGRCWIVSVVARVMKPGCKVDTVPVLEGSQGIGKSTALSILGGKWFIESHESVMSKDFFGVLNGHMLVEISEMHSFTRAEVERIKGVISCQVDRYRPAYGRHTVDHPRQTVLVCTTNRDDWQRDETGARRFWPIKCGSVNLDYIRENRDNLFAEAHALYENGGVWWDVPEELQIAEVEERREIDTWEPAIQSYLLGKTSALLSDILLDCIEIELSKQDTMAQRRVGRILRAIGWTCRVLRDGGKNRRMWVSPEWRQFND
jgi:predicted P-loop ATPase